MLDGYLDHEKEGLVSLLWLTSSRWVCHRQSFTRFNIMWRLGEELEGGRGVEGQPSTHCQGEETGCQDCLLANKFGVEWSYVSRVLRVRSDALQATKVL